MNIFIDMDGCIAKYDQSKFDGLYPEYLRPDTHVFLKCEADTRMIAILEELNKNFNVYILTGVYNQGSIALGHIADKWAWLQKNCPFIKKEQFIPTCFPKPLAIKTRGLKIDAQQILIDDYNRNLREWNEAGGCGVKYLNGINSSETYNGLNLDRDMTPEDVVKFFRMMEGFDLA